MGIETFTEVKVFSATKAMERTSLGDHITRWLAARRDLRVVDKIVTQSSDAEFHCLTITLFLEGDPKDLGKVRRSSERYSDGFSGRDKL